MSREDQGRDVIKQGLKTAKLHYYKVLEKTEDILSRSSGLSDTVYEFHQKCLNLTESASFDEAIITNFITKYQSQFASIYMSTKIFYPGIKIDTVPVRDAADNLVIAVRNMWNLATVKGNALDLAQFAQKVALNQTERETAIKAISNELAVIMNIMAVSLNKTAAKLRIKSESVTVDRRKMPIASPSEHSQ